MYASLHPKRWFSRLCVTSGLVRFVRNDCCVKIPYFPRSILYCAAGAEPPPPQGVSPGRKEAFAVIGCLAVRQHPNCGSTLARTRERGRTQAHNARVHRALRIIGEDKSLSGGAGTGSPPQARAVQDPEIRRRPAVETFLPPGTYSTRHHLDERLGTAFRSPGKRLREKRSDHCNLVRPFQLAALKSFCKFQGEVILNTGG